MVVGIYYSVQATLSLPPSPLSPHRSNSTKSGPIIGHPSSVTAAAVPWIHRFGYICDALVRTGEMDLKYDKIIHQKDEKGVPLSGDSAVASELARETGQEGSHSGSIPGGIDLDVGVCVCGLPGIPMVV